MFLACSDVEAAKRALSDSGIMLHEGRIHQGQGTANACAYFENAFFELLFPIDSDELESEAVRPLGLKERIEWEATGACPFGVCLRPAATLAGPKMPPVECWSYAPSYVPAGSSIPIATPPGSIHEPLVFLSTGRHPYPQGMMTMHRGETRNLTQVQIQYPAKWRPSEAVRWFAENSPLSLASGARYQMELVWGNGSTGRSKIPALPLCVSW